MSAIDDLNYVENAEYEESIGKLIEDANFRKVIVKLYVETRPPSPGIMNPEMLLSYNFAQGTRQWVHSIMSWVEATNPAAYLNLLNEVYQYEYRRRDAYRRDSESGGDDTDE